jgi:hypothetical protein
MTITYIFFYRAVKAQGVDRNAFAYTGWFQPYSVSGYSRSDTVEMTNSRSGIHRPWVDDLHCPLQRL